MKKNNMRALALESARSMNERSLLQRMSAAENRRARAIAYEAALAVLG